MTSEFIEWGVAAQIHQGENLSGDRYLIQPLDDRVLVAVIDGVGHGPEAAAASQTVVSALEAKAKEPLIVLITACHKALAGTRGVVMTLAMLYEAHDRLAWLGIGNVEGRLVRADKTSSHPEETLLLRSGVLGHDLPSTLNISALQVFKGDVLILATDGVRNEFTSNLHIGKSAHQIANDILARHSKGTDDALVVVVKYRGGGSSAMP